MQLVPYLNFDGQCEAAFRFYAEVLGGTVDLRTHGESAIAKEVPPEWHHLVLHARMTVGDVVLMGSDSPPGKHEKPQGVFVSIQVTDPAAAERIFGALATGGNVTMPMQPTFWALRFGMLVDRFGIPWMVNCQRPA